MRTLWSLCFYEVGKKNAKINNENPKHFHNSKKKKKFLYVIRLFNSMRQQHH